MAGTRCVAAILLASTMLAGAAHAQTVTWNGSVDGNWLNDANWTPGVQPQPGETALFNGATPRAITITGGGVDIDGLRFEPHGGAPYTFAVSTSFLTITGSGIVNTGAPAPTFTLVNSLVSFTGTASAGDAIFVNNAGGGLQFVSNASAGSAHITTNANAFTEFSASSNAGSSTLIVNGTDPANFGVLQLRDSVGMGSAQVTANAFGLILFQDSASAGNATVTLNADGVAAFSDTAHGGTARFIVNTGATLDMSFTTGEHNDGRVTVGSLEGGGDVWLPDFGTLVVGGNNGSGTFSGNLIECVCSSALEKVGTGTWVFNGTTDHTGPTVVSGGTLIVNSSIASSSGLTVEAAGTIGGTGILPSAVVNGTLSPGNSIGTITVQGTLAVSPTGSYLVEVSPTAADRTNVTTTATLGGTLRLRPTGGTYTIGQQYVILNAAGGRSGEFGTLDVSAGFGTVKPRIVYDNTNVIVVLDPNALTPMLPSGTGGNAGSAAGAIDRIVAAGGGDAFAGLFDLPPSALPAALSQLTGEIGTTGPMLWFEAMRLFLNAMTDPYAGFGGGGGPGGFASSFAPEHSALPETANAFASIGKAPPLAERRWSVWGMTFGSQSTAEGNPGLGTGNAGARNGNIAVGADYRIAPDTRIGFAVAGGSGSFNVAGLGSGRGDTYQLGVYGVTRLYDFYLAAAGAYAWADASTDRTVNAAGVTSRLTASYRPEAIGGRIEAGRRFAFGANGITPFAALLAEAARTPAYSEQATAGAGAFALTYGGTTTHRTRSELGIGLDTRLAAAGVDSLSLFARVAWAHEFSRDRAVTAAFQVLPAASFTVRGASAAEDAAVVTGGLDLALTRSVSVRGKVEGEFADGVTTYSATGALRVSW